jgi:DNA-binding response OmpR family regulator
MQPGISDAQVARIIAIHEKVSPQEYSLEADVCAIGRSPMCQIVVPQSTISRLHAKIERSGPRYILSDAGSINGTFVNGHRLFEPHLLKDADIIGLGSAVGLLRFLDPDPTAASAGQLRYDEHAMVFFLGQQRLDLSPAQFRLLSHLYQNADEVCTHESCAQAIWGPEYDPDQLATLDRAINRLRNRLRQVDPSADLIKNHRGLGYLLML